MQFLKIFLGVLALSNALVMTLPFQVRAADAQSNDPAYILIHAGQLLAIPGQPPERIKTIVIHGDSVMEIRDGFIEAQSLGLADGQTAETIDLREHFVLPGLMDAHIHLMWSGSDRPPKKQDQLNTQDLTLWTLRNARAALSAGFTTVRDMAADPDVMANF
jgi:imidazolonepropionase-like amidohydrolase